MPNTNHDKIGLEWSATPEHELKFLVDSCYRWLELYTAPSRNSFTLKLWFNALLRNNKDLPGMAIRFWSTEEPAISVKNLIEAILKYFKVDPLDGLFLQLYSFQLLAKLLTSDNSIIKLPALNHLTKHRLLVTIFLCASKFYFDRYCKNIKMAKAAGLTLPEMNQLEEELMHLIGWNLFPTIGPQQTVELLSSLPCATWEEMISHQPTKEEVESGEKIPKSTNNRFRMFFQQEQWESSSLPLSIPMELTEPAGEVVVAAELVPLNQ